MMATRSLITALLAVGVSAQRGRTTRATVVSSWGQCGGSGYSGPTACPTDMVCTVGNPWYAQCVHMTRASTGIPDQPLPSQPFPGVPDSPIETTSFQTVITITPTAAQPTVVTTYITFLTPRPTSTADAPAPAPTVITSGTITLIPDTPVTMKARWIEDAPAAEVTAPVVKPRVEEQKKAKREALQAARAEPEQAEVRRRDAPYGPQRRGPPTPGTLKSGQYWIRAVAAPNFHKYIQTNPQNEAGTAILGSSKTAGQYNIVSGQLVSAGSDTPFYMHVEQPADLTQRKLATWFNTTKNTFGTFAWSGDALTWSVPEIKRQNLAAWLVCEKSAMFINTGAYSYQTPAGCADQTIHYYNGATAND